MSTVAQPTPTQVQLGGIIRGLDMASDYCGSTQAWDSQRHIKEAAAAICLLDAARESLQLVGDAALMKQAQLQVSFDALTEANKKLSEALKRARAGFETVSVFDGEDMAMYGDAHCKHEIAAIDDALKVSP